MSADEHVINIAATSAVVPAGREFKTVEVLKRLLAESMHVIELHEDARWQISGSWLSKIRQVLSEHHKEQRRLVGLLAERIRLLDGIDPVYADGCDQSAKVCRVIRSSVALRHLLRALLEAHEAVLRAAKPRDARDDRGSVRDFAVGRAVLTNQLQWESISEVVLRIEPQQRLIQADAARLDE